MKSWAYVLFFSIFCMSLSSCLWNHGETRGETRHAACNLVKSRVIFNGSTYDRRQAQIETAEKALNEYTYDTYCE